MISRGTYTRVTFTTDNTTAFTLKTYLLYKRRLLGLAIKYEQKNGYATKDVSLSHMTFCIFVLRIGALGGMIRLCDYLLLWPEKHTRCGFFFTVESCYFFYDKYEKNKMFFFFFPKLLEILDSVTKKATT